MNFKSLLLAGCVGTAFAIGSFGPVAAETLRVMSGSASSPLNVPMNRAVVVESDQPFAELSIANPGIADITTLSDRTIYVLGKVPGRTTMTILAPDGKLIIGGDFSNVNGAPDTSGMAALDPTTGAVISGLYSAPSSAADQNHRLPQSGQRIYRQPKA